MASTSLTDEEMKMLLSSAGSKTTVEEMKSSPKNLYFIEPVTNGYIVTVFNGKKRRLIANSKEELIKIIEG